MLKRMFYSETYGKEMSLLKILNGEQANENSSLYSLEMEAIDKFLNMVTFYVDSIKNLYFDNNRKRTKPCCKINQALIEELDLQQSIYARQKTSESRKFIQERIVEVGNELSKKEESLKEFRATNRRIENSPNLLLIQERLGREVTVLNGVFTTLIQQLEMSKIEELKEVNFVLVVDPPEVPLQKSFPNKKKIVMFSLFFSLGFSVLVSLLWELLI